MFIWPTDVPSCLVDRPPKPPRLAFQARPSFLAVLKLACDQSIGPQLSTG